jgi:hypothetical protein
MGFNTTNDDDVNNNNNNNTYGRLCVLVVRVPGYRSRGPGSIPGVIRFSEKYWVWNRIHLAS